MNLVPTILAFYRKVIEKTEYQEKLETIGLSKKSLQVATASFISTFLNNFGRRAERYCAKDPDLTRDVKHLYELFPNSKHLLMVRDVRAIFYSLRKRILSSGLNEENELKAYRSQIKNWKNSLWKGYNDCIKLVGPGNCMPVFYEQLVLHPEANLKKITKFLGENWSENLLKHEKFIGNKIFISKSELSTSQIVKPINLEALNAWSGKISENALKIIKTELNSFMTELGYNLTINSSYPFFKIEKAKQNTLFLDYKLFF